MEQGAVVAERVVAQGGDELRRHELRVAGGLHPVQQAARELLTGGGAEVQADADPAGEGEQLLALELVEQAGVAGEQDGEDGVRVEAGAGEEAQLVEHRGLHLLGLVDEQDRARERAVDVGLPALAQGTAAAPAVAGAKLDTEDVTHLAIEITEIALRMGDDTDGDVGDVGELGGGDAQHGALAQARIAREHGEAALAEHDVHDPPAKLGDGRRGEQGVRGSLGEKGFHFKP